METLLTKRLLSIVVVAISAYLGYYILRPDDPTPVTARVKELSLSSSIPNMYVAAKRHTVVAVDLRRSQLLLGMQTDQEITIQPLLDAVLCVPKTFPRARDRRGSA